MNRSTTRTATAVVVVLVLVAGVVAALLGSGGGRDGAASTTRTSASAARTTTSAPRATAGTARPPTSSSARSARDRQTGLRVVALSSLPAQAQQTIALIDNGGPFPYSQDGVTFGNNERHLPAHPRGYYREYTVKTPGESDRGPRRIVTGGADGADREIYYTADHYDSFVRVR